jgi:hypothetical protein
MDTQGKYLALSAIILFGMKNSCACFCFGLQKMDVCPRFSVLCCPVQVEALQWADAPSKVPYQNI